MVDHRGYSISTEGRVRNDRTGTVRKQYDAKPYMRVTLNGVPIYVHREVLRAFVGEPGPGQACRHLDGNPKNNRLGNLAWGSYVENSRDQRRHGTQRYGEEHHSTYLTNEDVLAIFSLRGVMPSPHVAIVFGASVKTVSNIWTGVSWGWLTGA